jgi:hypothetical protein
MRSVCLSSLSIRQHTSAYVSIRQHTSANNVKPKPLRMHTSCRALCMHTHTLEALFDIQSKRARYACATATHAYLIRYACATATHAYLIRYDTYATHAYLTSKASARATHPHLMRYCYACIPHTLRMHTSYGTTHTLRFAQSGGA